MMDTQTNQFQTENKSYVMNKSVRHKRVSNDFELNRLIFGEFYFVSLTKFGFILFFARILDHQSGFNNKPHLRGNQL